MRRNKLLSSFSVRTQWDHGWGLEQSPTGKIKAWPSSSLPPLNPSLQPQHQSRNLQTTSGGLLALEESAYIYQSVPVRQECADISEGPMMIVTWQVLLCRHAGMNLFCRLDEDIHFGHLGKVFMRKSSPEGSHTPTAIWILRSQWIHDGLVQI